MLPEEPRTRIAHAATLVGTLGDGSSPETCVTVDLSDAGDRDLVRRIGRGDGEAFRGLFGRYAPSALALARRVVRQPFLAEEIVQEAFLAVWKNPGGYDDRRGSVRSWLMGMVHHRAVDAVRREESQRRRAEEAQTNGLVVAPDPADRSSRSSDSPRSAGPSAPRSTSCPKDSAR